MSSISNYRRRILALSLTLLCATVSAEEAFPKLKPGLWSFQQTKMANGKPTGAPKELQQCADPGAEMRERWAKLAATGCQFSPITVQGTLYSYSSTCVKNSEPVSTRSAVMVLGAGDYRVVSQSQFGTQVTQVRIVAHRLGECANETR